MYKVTFTDNSEFIGGEFTDSKWNEMPQKPIQKIEYKMGNKNIIAEGYEAYNHVVEKLYVFQKGQAISKVMLMLKKDEDVLVLVYNLIRKKFDYEIAIFGKEYNNRATTGWKIGIENCKGKCEIK